MTSGISREQNQKRKQIAGDFSRREILLTGTSVAAAAVLLDGISPALAGKSATPIYAIRQNGDMLFYEHTGVDDGSPNWPIQAAQIGNGWDFRQVFAGDNGAVYAIRRTARCFSTSMRVSTTARPTGRFQAVQIGNGWDFRQVFAGDNGAVYAIRENGDMLFYKHAGFNDGLPNWPIPGRADR